MKEQTKIHSDLSNIHDIEIFLNNISYQYNISRKQFFRIYLAVIEGVTNSIKHGNSYDKRKFVDVIFIDNIEFFEVHIIDEGQGFNYQQLPDPTSAENLVKESGRGIFIMKQYADKVYFENHGSKVKLIFNK